MFRATPENAIRHQVVSLGLSFGVSLSIISVAQLFSFSMVAEGVATEEQRVAVRSLGCNLLSCLSSLTN